MSRQLEIYQTLAQSLANLFSPMVEVSLFDSGDQQVCVFNRLTTEVFDKTIPHQIAKVVINKTQKAKMIVIPLENNFYLRLIAETSLFDSLQIFLQKYLHEESVKDEIGNWQQGLDSFIDNYLDQQRTTLSSLTTCEKRALILAIHEKEFFRYQDATKYLASKLNVSRATIYNYLKQANEFKSVEIHQVDAFTDEPFSGNPAGVVLDADHLSETVMKKITREMNLSETSFLLKSKEADIRLRYFTPNGSEVKFCGHSTVGALYMLARQEKLNITKPGLYKLTLETLIGILPVAITLAQDQTITVEFETPAVDLVMSEMTYDEVAQALGIPLHVIDQTKPIMFEKNNQDLYVTIKTLTDLESLNVDQKSAKQFSDNHDIVAFALLTNQTFADNSHIHMRCFAPLVGIPEDPFTGSVLGGLATYIRKNELIASEMTQVRVEQGHFIARPGFVDLKLPQECGEPPVIVAKARHFFSTKIDL